MRCKGVKQGEAILLHPRLRLWFRRLEEGDQRGQQHRGAQAGEEGRVLGEGPEDGEGQGRVGWGGEQPREEPGAYGIQEAGAGCCVFSGMWGGG